MKLEEKYKIAADKTTSVEKAKQSKTKEEAREKITKGKQCVLKLKKR